MSKKILLIIPAYNEEKNIEKVYEGIVSYNEKNKIKYDVIVINDGSTDDTEIILKNNGIPHISLVNNLGIGGAVQTGYKYAQLKEYDIAVQFDGDGQHEVECVKDIVEPIVAEKYNMVIGSRFIDVNSSKFKSSGARRLGILIISFFMKLVTKNKIYDTTSGFRAVDKQLIYKFAKDYPSEYPEPVSTTQILCNGFKVKEVPVSMRERENGSSSIRSWKNFYYMFNVILSIIFFGMRRKNK